MVSRFNEEILKRQDAGKEVEELLKWLIDALVGEADALRLPPEIDSRLRTWTGMPSREIVHEVAVGLREELESKQLLRPSLAFFGPTGAGKSSLVNVLFGEALSEVGPAAGTTREPARWTHRMGVDVLDTPGFLDPDRPDDEAAIKLLPATDIRVLVFDINAFRREDARLAHRLHGVCPITFAVINKVDIPPEQELDSAVTHIRRYLPPIRTVQVSALRGDNLNLLIRALYEALPDVRQQILLIGWLNDRQEAIAAEIEAMGRARDDAAAAASRIIEEIRTGRDKAAQQAILKAAARAATIAASPIPQSDLVPLIKLQHHLVVEIALIYGHQDVRSRLGSLFGPLVAGAVGRAIFRQVLKLAPVAGGIAASAIAAAGTYAIGQTARKVFREDLPPDEVARISNSEMDKLFDEHVRSKEDTE